MLKALSDHRHRRGVTLIELLVVMTIGGLALGLVASIGVREQRVVGDLTDASALSGQLRDASAILPIDLRAASASAGDIREARDTAIELRGTIATGVVCDTAAHTLVLAPTSSGSDSFSGSIVPIDAGDTAWMLTVTDSTDAWLPTRVSSATTVKGAQCAATGPWLSTSNRTVSRVGIVVDAAAPLTSLIGTPIRVTRSMRFSLYRASDNAWYLGERDWNAASQKFNTIQPVSGPFLSAASHGLWFRYQDSLGTPLVSPVSDTRAIALIGVELRGQTRSAVRILGEAQTTGKRADSSMLSISVRNRR
ncbi:MAG TPA: prepilin-type N-terminal cleavage/methylation domain-containing protein [Gemmatimonadaceae bacterium]|jgi:prepilin-type N-terminal cleavage/methylation domain-containing protein